MANNILLQKLEKFLKTSPEHNRVIELGYGGSRLTRLEAVALYLVLNEAKSCLPHCYFTSGRKGKVSALKAWNNNIEIVFESPEVTRHTYAIIKSSIPYSCSWAHEKRFGFGHSNVEQTNTYNKLVADFWFYKEHVKKLDKAPGGCHSSTIGCCNHSERQNVNQQ